MLRISAPPLPGAAGRFRDPGPRHPLSASVVVFHTQGDQTMTYALEIQIEELRAELRNACDVGERREIEAELECAQAELAVLVAEQDGRLEAEPPF
ncbi:hypothetical protein ASD54_22250 [Rhizobium sp. Root149]|nr:hypothetical protein ASD54_22250 [Rhizobium sp. Root149]